MRNLLRALLVLLPIASLVALTIATPSPVRADGVVVWTRLPAERRAEMTSALRLELAGRAILVEGPAVDPDHASVGEMRDEARAAAATHAVWVVFPGGLLAPAEVRVLAVERTTAAHAMAPQAWDVVDLRVVAVLAASLVEAASAEPELAASVEIVAAPEPPVVIAQPDSAPSATVVAPAPPIEPSPEHLTLTEPGTRPARTFSLWMGPSFAHIRRPGSDTQLTWSGQMAFYARMTEWASLGLRLRGGAGYSSIEGALINASVGVPSIAVSFREPLGTAAMIELGVHAEGGLFLDYYENAVAGRATRLSFGLGVGAFVGVELGAANGLLLDYTLEIYGFGDAGTWTWGNLTLAYVHRWD